jgi:hypothetical protein
MEAAQMSCSMRLHPVRWFKTGAEAHAWRESMGLPKASLHFVRGKGWRMQLHDIEETRFDVDE